MKHDTITQSKAAGICAPSTTGGIMEVEHSASPLLRQASQGHDGHITHPSILGDGKRTPETWVGKESAAMKDEVSLGIAFGKPPKRVVEIDTAKYQKYLDDPALSNDQKEEIVEAIWTIITAFVDLGFGIHPLQEAIGDKACGQLSQEVDQSGNTDSNDPNPNLETLTNAFNAASDDT